MVREQGRARTGRRITTTEEGGNESTLHQVGPPNWKYGQRVVVWEVSRIQRQIIGISHSRHCPGKVSPGAGR